MKNYYFELVFYASSLRVWNNDGYYACSSSRAILKSYWHRQYYEINLGLLVINDRQKNIIF